MGIPQVTVKVSENVRAFLVNMETLLREENDLVIIAHLEEQTDIEPYSLGFSTGDVGSLDPVGIFSAWKDEDPRIRIDVFGEWKTFFPSYEEYVGRARELFDDRLKAYCRKYGKRYRLTIPSHEATLPRLTPSLQRQFDRFVRLANMRCLHEYDWIRFYQFIARSQRYQPQLSREDIDFLFRKAGFSGELAKYLSDVFYRCREFNNATKVGIRRK